MRGMCSEKRDTARSDSNLEFLSRRWEISRVRASFFWDKKSIFSWSRSILDDDILIRRELIDNSLKINLGNL